LLRGVSDKENNGITCVACAEEDMMMMDMMDGWMGAESSNYDC
jgi:hypothetical protein